MFHISDIKKFKKCPRLFYLSKGENNTYLPYLRSDESLGDLLIKKLKIENYYLGERGDKASRVLENLDNYEWFVKARFEYADLRVKIPVLHKIDKGYEVYFSQFTLSPKIEDINFFVYNIWVLKMLKLDITNIKIIYLNAEYIRKESLDVDQLLKISEYFYDANNNRVCKIYNLIDNKNNTPLEFLEKMKNLSLPKAQNTYACKAHGGCQYYKTCFKETDLPDDSILYLVSSAHKRKMYQKGIIYLKDADPSLLEGTRSQYAQILASRNGGLYVDKLALSQYLKTFKDKNLVFLDFEWERFIIPAYNGLKPYDAVCFEYSIHLWQDNQLSHHDFIDINDCREAFIKSLINVIPKDAYIFAYNAKGAECLRLKELASQFPEYKDELDDINRRIYDLSDPFIKGLVYDTRLRGNYSIKALIKVVSDLSYDNLSIHDGMDAVYRWRKIDKEESQDADIVKEELREYCGLDSYALVLVYRWLTKLLDE